MFRFALHSAAAQLNQVVMNKDSRFITILVASLTAGTALYILVRGWWEIIYFFSSLVRGDYPFDVMPWWMMAGGIVIYLVTLGKTISAYGVYRLRPWGWGLALLALSIDFLYRLFGAINYFTFSIQHPEPLPIPPGYADIKVVSLWPSYIICLISLLSIVALTRKSVKVAFKKGYNIPVHNKAVERDTPEKPRPSP